MKEFNNYIINHLDESNSPAGREEYNKLINSVNLLKEESYDCTRLNVWSYRKASDIRDGVNVRFSNMCNGFPLEIAGTRFFNSECAYIAGAYAGSRPGQIEVQRLVAAEKNGMKCKRVYRRKPEFTSFQREDFYSYNVQWMIFVLWQKCLQNSHFSDLLKAIPIDAHVVENTSFHKGESSTFWGAKNRELTLVRQEAEKEVALHSKFRFKKDIVLAQMQASNTINNMGHFEGGNVMGKIIKICSLSLLYGQDPPMDYTFLQNRNLFLCGKPIEFQKHPRV